MIRTISHTSNSGSTFLAAKLSKSLPVYAEPSWSHKMYELDDDSMYKMFHENYQDGSIVKLSSVCTPMIKNLEGKHVFLYHTAYQHLIKKTKNVRTVIGSTEFYTTFMRDRENKNIPKYYDLNSLNTCLLYPLSYWWTSKVLDMMDAENVLWVNANMLYADTENTCKQICHFLEIEYVPTIINYHVKSETAKYKGHLKNDYPIEINEDRNKDPDQYIDPNDSIIDFHQRGNEHIIDAVEWIRNNLGFTDNQLLYGF